MLELVLKEGMLINICGEVLEVFESQHGFPYVTVSNKKGISYKYFIKKSMMKDIKVIK